MDADLQQARRTGDPVAELVALTRMPSVRSLPPCRHCGRDLSRVEVRCSPCDDGWDTRQPTLWVRYRCRTCRGTRRREWPWRGDTGRLALLAYAGDEAAGACLGSAPGYLDSPYPPHLDDGSWCWVRPETWLADIWKLDRWPGALLAAGILAGRAVLGRSEIGRSWYQRETAAIEALDAATEHHHCGCVKSREAWIRSGPEVPWVPWGAHSSDYQAAIQAAIRETDEPTIRAAICAGLAGWARTGVL